LFVAFHPCPSGFIGRRNRWLAERRPGGGLIVTKEIEIAEVDFSEFEKWSRSLASPRPFLHRSEFYTFSHGYFSANGALLAQAGFGDVESTMRVLRLSQNRDLEIFLPFMHVETEAGDAQMMAAPSFLSGLVSDPARTSLTNVRAAEIVVRLERVLPDALFWEDDLGWDLRLSHLGTFRSFSEQERGYLARCEDEVTVETGDLDADWGDFKAYLFESLANKERKGLPIIKRNHEALRETFGNDTRLTFVKSRGERIGAGLWVKAGEDAAIAEWVGTSEFRRKKIQPVALFRLLASVKQSGATRLRGYLFEWFIAPIWEVFLSRVAHDPRETDRLLGGMPRLHRRGLTQLESA
jgi:hypothetical protein